MTPPRNSAPTDDEIIAMRQDVEKDIKAADEYKKKQRSYPRLIFYFICAYPPFLLGMNSTEILESTPSGIAEMREILQSISTIMVIIISALITLYVLFWVFKRAPKPQCTHSYGMLDFAATSEVHRKQNSHLIINDNPTIQQYLKDVEAQGRPLYKFELKHFSDILMNKPK